VFVIGQKLADDCGEQMLILLLIVNIYTLFESPVPYCVLDASCERGPEAQRVNLNCSVLELGGSLYILRAQKNA